MASGTRLFTPSILPRLRRRHSLRWRLLALLGGMLIITLVIIGMSVFYFIFQNEQRTWQERQSEAARHAGETVAAFVQRMEDTLTVAGAFHGNNLITNPQLILRILQQNPAMLELVRTDAGGRVFAKAAQDEILLANQFTLQQSRWFQAGRAGQLYLSEVQISPVGEPYVIMSIPTPDGGVVAARLRMNVLWEVVAGLRFGRTGQAYVINRAGQIVAHPNPEVVLTLTGLDGRPELSALLQAPEHRWTGTYTNFRGTRVTGLSGPVPGTEWIVVTEVTRSEASAVSRTALLLLSGGLALFGLLVMLVTGRLLQQTVLQPMENLRLGAEQIGQGDLSYRIKVLRQDELGQVAAAFNKMAAKLHVQRALLEHRVQERTAALAQTNNTLRQEISERRRAEEQLQNSLQEKEILLKEIHHRVKNNLQVISSLLNLQSAYIEDAALLDILQESQNRVRSMALIHEKLYRSDNLAQIDFGDYIQELSGFLFRAQDAARRGINLKTRTGNIYLTIETAVPCGLIVNELVSNTLKHAFPNGHGGEVNIKLARDSGGRIVLAVADNGIGFPAGLDFKNTESLGLQLVNTLVDQIDGDIRLNTGPAGTTFTVAFNLPEQP